MSAEIVWADPPLHGTSVRASKYQPFADALRAYPGRWAVFPGGRSYSKVTAIKTGRYSAFPPGEFDAMSRQGTIYVRYVGDKS